MNIHFYLVSFIYIHICQLIIYNKKTKKKKQPPFNVFTLNFTVPLNV